MCEEWNDEQNGYWFSSISVIDYLMKRAIAAALRSHLCVYGCSSPRLIGRGSLDDRRTQTQAADSGRRRTWTLLWSSSLRKHKEDPHRCTWTQMLMNVRVHVFADTHTHGELTVSGRNGPVLCSEAAACDAAIRVEGDPHRAAVCVHCWWRHVTTEPAGGRETTFNNRNLSFG